MKKETIDTLMTRRSVRKFKPDPVPQETLERLMEIATYAPTGKGKQNALIVVVQDKETTDELRRMNAAAWDRQGIDPYYGASVIALVFSSTDGTTHVEDGSSVLTYLTVAAHALDIGACWINREFKMFNTDEGKAMKESWGIPENYVGIGGIALGYMDGKLPNPAPRKPDYVRWV